MRKELIIRFIDGKCTKEEAQSVLQWIDKDKRNKRYYIELINMIADCSFVSEAMPSEGHKLDAASISDINEIVSYNKSSKRAFGLRIVLPIAASLVLIAAIGLNLYQWNKSLEQPKEVIKIMDGATIRNIGSIAYYTEKGVKCVITLPDSSKVWLNSDSKLTIPEVFTGKYREVDFYGEAYFEVTHNEKMPMIITTENGAVEVLGTTFNIRAYDDDHSMSTTLLSGLVKIKSNQDKYSDNYLMELKPNQTALVVKNVPVRNVTMADTSKTLAWKDGRLVFDETPMTKVIKELERWHGCKFVIEDKDVLSYNITATFDSKSIIQIMEMIRFCSPTDYRIVDDVVYLSSRKIHV